MAYKWRPSKSAKQEFARNMQNPEFANDYYARKEIKAGKRRQSSQFDYSSAGGSYIPTNHQYNKAFEFLTKKELTSEQIDACNIIISGYSCNEKVHHDYIHILNELIRTKE